MPDNSPNPSWKNQGSGQPKKDAAVPSWKKEAGGSGGTSAGGGNYGWKNPAPTPVTEGPKSKTMRLVVALGLFGLIAAAVVIVVLWLQPVKPACLVLVGSSYDVNLSLPHNVYGWEGLNKLRGLTDLRLAYPLGEAEEAQEKKTWAKLLQELPKSFSEEAIIVAFALHGGADDGAEAKDDQDSKAFLFLGDPRAQEKVYLKTIFQDLTQRWPTKKILVVLEPTQLVFHWPSGMLQNHFVRELKKLTKEIEQQPNLLVMCSSAENQVSWASEKSRRTIFMQSLMEGLQGMGREADARITASDVFEHVKGRVAQWSQSNRGVVQTPIMLGGDRRAQSMLLVQISAPYSAGDEGGSGVFSPSSNLTLAWNTSAALRRQVPIPEVSTPHLWRQYRDMLLRWEQLERAGAASRRTEILKDRCDRLEAEIRKKARVDVPTRGIVRALPLPGVMGLGLAKDKTRLQAEAIKENWPQLWRAPDKEKLAQALQDAFKTPTVTTNWDSEEGKILFGQLCRELLVYVRDNPSLADDIRPLNGKDSKVLAFVHRLDDLFEVLPPAGVQYPAELNYLVMLLKDVDPKSPPAVAEVQTALRVRLLAEEAALVAAADVQSYPYSEVGASWIRLEVAQADDARRQGEDWLVASEPVHQDLARGFLISAKDKYEKALADAALVRDALDMRDRVLADLPYYAEWLARRRTPADDEQTQLVRQVETLAAVVGDLAWCLNQGSFEVKAFMQPNAARNPEKLDARQLLKTLTAKVKLEFVGPVVGLHDKFEKLAQKLKNTHLQTVWHELEAVLAVPLVEDPSLRRTLLENSSDLSKKLGEGIMKFADEEKSTASPAAADLQRRLALAATVRAWQGDAAAEDVGTNSKASALIASYWHGLAELIAKDYEAGCQLADVDQAADKLVGADMRCRLLLGWAVPNWTEPPYGPAQLLRSVRVHGLLLNQGTRARDDYYWTITAGDKREPYYRPAALDYAHMAEGLSESAGKDLAIQAALKRKAEIFAAEVKDINLTVTPPADAKWTSEQVFPLTWRIDAKAPVPPGVPMYWMDQQGAKPAIREPAKEKETAATYTLTAAATKYQDVPTTFYCIYRGQKIVSPITPKRWEPDTIVQHFPPDEAAVSFKLAKDFDYGAVCIMLDCSGSMKNVLGKMSRFKHAVKALDYMLATIPNNTFVSLVIFIEDENSYDGKVRLVRPARRWNKNNRAKLIAEVEDLERYIRYGLSPIARTLIDCLSLGFPTNAEYPEGRKVIIALSDGDDNNSYGYKDPQKTTKAEYDDYNAKISGKLIDAFKNSGVELHVVCFNAGDNPESREETERARRQFETAIDNLRGGSFKVQPDPRKLGSELETAIRPRLYLYKGTDLVRGFDKAGEPLNPTNEQRHWLDKGKYSAFLEKSHPVALGDIDLRPGDLLNLELRRDGRNVFLERTPVGSLESPHHKIAKDAGGNVVMASIYENTFNQMKAGVVNQVVTLEALPDGTQGRNVLRQERPGFLWLEIKPARDFAKPAKDVTPRRITWQRRYGYPALALGVETEGWPRQNGSEAPTETTVWWTKQLANPAFFKELPRSLSKKDSKDSSPRMDEIRVGEADVRFEEVTMETHVVPSGDKTTEKNCLVVRVQHTNNKPVFVQLRQYPEDKQAAEQHRYYAGAQKYTALFWDLPDSKATRFIFQVISLDDFKKVSAAAGTSIQFPSLTPDTHPGTPPISFPGAR